MGVASHPTHAVETSTDNLKFAIVSSCCHQ